MAVTQKIKYGILGITMVVILIYLFYDNLLLGFIISPIGLLYIPYKKNECIKERKRALRNEFREGLYSLSASLGAGKSIEYAFEDALKDLYRLYDKKNNSIIDAFEQILRRLSMNDSIEEALYEFAENNPDEDIRNFVNVFMIAKRSGGNMMEIMKYTVTVISEKMEIESSIELSITAKKYEQKVLVLLIPFIILYLRGFSKGFIDCLYDTFAGQFVMTICLCLYIAAVLISKKIMDIEV